MSKRIENELSDAIHKIERYLEDRYRTSPILASIQLDSQTYFGDLGHPSRFLSIRYPKHHSELRFNLQRNSGSGVTHAWTLGQSTYVDDGLIQESEKDFHNLPNILRYLRDSYLGEEAASAFMSVGNKTFRIKNVRPPTTEELLDLDINPRDAKRFIAGIIPGDKNNPVYGVYDRAYLLRS